MGRTRWDKVNVIGSMGLPLRLENNIEPCPESGCWLWIGRSDEFGYGKTEMGGRQHLAHRLIYALLKGPIPPGLTIDHLCRVRACVNPDHLEPVTLRVNILRGTGFPARYRQRTHCQRGHPYEGENLVISKTGARLCRACRNIYEAIRRQLPAVREYHRNYDRLWHAKRRAARRLEATHA